MIFWVLGAIGGVLVIAIGTVVLISRTLAATESSAIYDIDKAAEYVSDNLADEITARLAYEDVVAVLLWHLAFLRERGFATFGGVDLGAQKAAFGGDDVIAREEEAVDYVLAAASDSEREIEAVDVVSVVELNNDYLDAIGALGVRTDLT